ncbi:SusC/RagA family TonB-linked outer membrane protein [Marinoscillum furvescens]|uniref:TonB-linked SusC/RagA family outer membrane protein n=1 Tax=Marinoscillum furvescens DSM 4134 TaxID=1122208 RepID=A0A3D9L126_MARFU|nr:TonB-dependent receptor [Marinoscillum furvescens]RED95278.1 TonB-linked SusC/RagA family outer membrane protein [Marinoscillum furvescens DSM 4134]
MNIRLQHFELRQSGLLLGLLLCLMMQPALAQETVSGVVTAARSGEPVIGATVIVRGTANGTITDVDGRFTLQASVGQTLQISFVGFESQELEIRTPQALNIALSEDIQSLEEVVVVGYGSVQKSDLTGSVSSVDVESLEKLASVDINRNLQGKVAGVQVMSNSGAPGAGTTVRIRGVGSFGSAGPLYVVDGFLTGDISNISPADIESMEVLKDASATAIYGSRGANGVIIITTKQGLKSGLEVEVNAYAGIQQAWKTQDLLDAKQFAELYVESLSGPGEAWDINAIDDSGKKSWVRDALAGNITGTDWQDEVLRNGAVQNYNLMVRGGTGKLRYKVGGTFFQQEGIVVNTSGETLRGQANLQYRPTDRIEVTADFKYSQYDNINYSQGTYGSVLGTALRKDPINPVKDPTTGHWDRTGLTDIANPARVAYEQQFRTATGSRYVPSFSASWELMPGLTAKSLVTYDHRENNSRSFTPTNTTIESRYLVDGEPQVSPNESLSVERLFTGSGLQTVLQNSNTLAYDKSLGAHSINAVIGVESYQQDSEYNSTNPSGDNPPVIRAFNMLSYFGRATYSYDSRYLITGTLRRDGSSKFPEEGRWGTFPSFSLGWNVDREAFFPSQQLISAIKLRGGWGRIGNQDPVSPYGFYATLSPNWEYAFDNKNPSPGYASSQLPASTLRWETSEMVNVGADLMFFNDQLSITGEYFVKNTLDLLVEKLPVPNFAGAIGPRSNAASMKNWGSEFTIDYKQNVGSLIFNVGGNISFINNEVTDLGAGDIITGAGYESKIGMPATRTSVGEEFATFYGLRTVGIFQNQAEIDARRAYNEQGQPINGAGEVVAANSEDHKIIQDKAAPGDVIYEDVNNDGYINSDDAVALGSAIPEFTYGFYLSANYQNFDLSIAFSGVYGNEIANIFTFYNEGSSAADNNLLVSRMDRWTAEGSTNTQPRVTDSNTQNDLFSDRFIEDGSFLRLRNLQVGYSLPKALLTKVKLKQVRFYLSADNLLTFTKYSGFDPEIGLAYGDPFGAGVDLGSYPQARTFFIGTNIKF